MPGKRHPKGRNKRKRDGPQLPGFLHRQLEAFDDGGVDGREFAPTTKKSKQSRKELRATKKRDAN